ncbi:hypothetical protein GCM10022286_16290 [Gryllotalpicola daejeonensis]|uniref:Pilus assembly protein PilO n=1 Tax=Gryllotalpicola daejeonensis TaxID=993087 RepID=A0ABP7ZJL2_9MICO
MISANRLWAFGAFVVAIGLVALGWFMGVSPQLDARSTALDSLASVQSTNAQLEAKVGKLARDAKNKDALQATFDALNVSLPNSAATSDFMTQLNGAASAAGVTLSGISVTAAQPYAAPAAPQQQAASSSGSKAATPAPAPTAQPGMPPFTSPAVNGNNLAVVPVTLTATGDYGKVLNFVKNVQNLKRYFLVTAISTTPQTGTDAGGAAVSPTGVTATITGDIFSITGQATASAG